MNYLVRPKMYSSANLDLTKDQSQSNISPTSWRHLLKTSFNQVWNGSTITPTESLIVWRRYGTFNGNANFVSYGTKFEMRDGS